LRAAGQNDDNWWEIREYSAVLEGGQKGLTGDVQTVTY
jgi:hypothetical protein